MWWFLGSMLLLCWLDDKEDKEGEEYSIWETNNKKKR